MSQLVKALDSNLDQVTLIIRTCNRRIELTPVMEPLTPTCPRQEECTLTAVINKNNKVMFLRLASNEKKISDTLYTKSCITRYSKFYPQTISSWKQLKSESWTDLHHINKTWILYKNL